jgi:hypothetical protein
MVWLSEWTEPSGEPLRGFPDASWCRDDASSRGGAEEGAGGRRGARGTLWGVPTEGSALWWQSEVTCEMTKYPGRGRGREWGGREKERDVERQ